MGGQAGRKLGECSGRPPTQLTGTHKTSIGTSPAANAALTAGLPQVCDVHGDHGRLLLLYVHISALVATRAGQGEGRAGGGQAGE